MLQVVATGFSSLASSDAVYLGGCAPLHAQQVLAHASGRCFTITGFHGIHNILVLLRAAQAARQPDAAAPVREFLRAQRLEDVRLARYQGPAS